MQVHTDLDHLPVFRKAIVTIGTFDGVHLGHRQIIEKLKAEAKAVGGETVIITFHPHPRRVVSSGSSTLRLINTLQEKIVLLEGYAIDHLVVCPFTDSFANQDAAAYIKDFLVGRFHPHTIIIGYDHRFGKERKGDYLLLEDLAPEFKYILKEIPKHVLDEISISSTRIRDGLSSGRVGEANRLLGYDFFFSGKVVKGDQLGRTLGYPTANLQVHDPEKITPGDGIYAVYAALAGNEARKMRGMMSIGFRPTVEGTYRVIEVNLFNFNSDIYGEELTVSVVQYLRPEIKFPDLPSLVAQIDQDKADSLRLLE